MAKGTPPPTLLTTIDVAETAGANLGAKLQAAHNALPSTGGVLDCRRLIGAQAISATVTISKVCEILLGASQITSSAAIGIEFTDTSIGSIIRGAGKKVTVFTGTGGRTHIKLTGSSRTKISDIGCTWTTDNASNIGIFLEMNGVTALQRVLVDNCEVLGGGAGTLGEGIRVGTVYSSTIANCYIENVRYGINMPQTGANAANAIFVHNNRIHDTEIGIRIMSIGDIFIYSNTIEGAVANGKSVYAEESAEINSAGNHYEQVGAGTPIDVHIIAPLVDPLNTRVHTFTGDTFSGPAVPLRTNNPAQTTIWILGGGNGSSQFESTGGAPFIFLTTPLGTTSGNWTQYTNAAITGNSAQILTISGWDYTLVTRTLTETAVTNVEAQVIDLICNPAANSGANARGLLVEVYTQSGTIRNFTNVLQGIYSYVLHQGTGASTLTLARSIFTEVQLGTAGIITSAEALSARIQNTGTGTITSGAAINVLAPVNSGGGAITTYYGLAIADVGTAASTSYSIQTAGGQLDFLLISARSENFTIRSSTETNYFRCYSASNTVAIGTTEDAQTRLSVAFAPTTINVSWYAISAQMQYNPSAASPTGIAYSFAANSFSPAANANNFLRLVGVDITADHRGSGTATDVFGLNIAALKRNAGPVTNLYGVQIELDNLAAGGSVTSAYGIRVVSATNSGTMTTFAAIKIEATTSASDNYAIWTAGGKLLFQKGTLSALTAGTEYIWSQFDMTGTWQFATGAIATQRAVVFNAPTYSFVGASTITTAVTIDIDAAPTAGTNATITNRLALRVGGAVEITGAPSASTGHTLKVTQSAQTGGTPKGVWFASGAHLDLANTSGLVFFWCNGGAGGQWNYLGGGGAIADMYTALFDSPQLTADAAQTVTRASTIYVSAAPSAGTNITITDAYAIYVAAGKSSFTGGGILLTYIVTAFAVGETLDSKNCFRFVTNEGAGARVDFTLPAATAGLTFKFYVQDADGIRVTAGAGDTIRMEALVSAAAGRIDSTTIGSCTQLVAINDTEWVAEFVTGVWTVT